MQQMRINRMGNGMFHAPQTGPSMSPAFMFANQAPVEEPPPRLAQQQPPAAAPVPAPVPVAPAPAVVAPAMTWRDWAGPVAVVALVGALIAWNVR